MALLPAREHAGMAFEADAAHVLKDLRTLKAIMESAA